MGFDNSFLIRDCPWCGLRDAQFRLLAADAAATSIDERRARIWSFLSCPRCAAFVALETNPHGARPPDVYMTFPEHEAQVQVRSLPSDVEGYYRDAMRVLDAGVPDAVAVQLRRTLEAAAAHHGITSGPLVQRIQKLIDEGLITKDFARVLQHIREVGNVGAHASDQQVDEETARRALRFTTQVLRNLFEIPAELDALDEDETPPTANAG